MEQDAKIQNTRVTNKSLSCLMNIIVYQLTQSDLYRNSSNICCKVNRNKIRKS